MMPINRLLVLYRTCQSALVRYNAVRGVCFIWWGECVNIAGFVHGAQLLQCNIKSNATFTLHLARTIRLMHNGSRLCTFWEPTCKTAHKETATPAVFLPKVIFGKDVSIPVSKFSLRCCQSSLSHKTDKMQPGKLSQWQNDHSQHLLSVVKLARL